jgi:hypothetical protein
MKRVKQPALPVKNEKAQAERIADDQFESWCEEKASRIEKTQATAVLEVAAHLAEVHQQYLYRRFEGGFRGWVEDRLKISRQTAYSLLNVHKRFGGQSVKNLDTLPRSALCLLAAPSTPEAARTEVVERAKKGENVSHKQVKRSIDKHKSKRPARACASSSSAPDSEKVAAPVPVPTTVPTTPEQSAEDRKQLYKESETAPTDAVPTKSVPTDTAPTEDDIPGFLDRRRPSSPAPEVAPAIAPAESLIPATKVPVVPPTEKNDWPDLPNPNPLARGQSLNQRLADQLHLIENKIRHLATDMKAKGRLPELFGRYRKMLDKLEAELLDNSKAEATAEAAELDDELAA